MSSKYLPGGGKAPAKKPESMLEWAAPEKRHLMVTRGELIFWLNRHEETRHGASLFGWIRKWWIRRRVRNTVAQISEARSASERPSLPQARRKRFDAAGRVIDESQPEGQAS